MPFKSDIEIARETSLEPINTIASSIGISSESIIPYGKHIAKIPLHCMNYKKAEESNLILVTAITPTKAGIGKTTISIGLTLGLNKIGKKAIVALREPSLGPCFGMKGGAAGGGYAQVLPMEAINLHFTGDFHAVTSAHNMISALLDNYQYNHQGTDKALTEIIWKRVLDVNDRALRNIVTGLGGKTDGVTAQSGFDITPASEIMAILCLSKDLEDLKRRIENITLGYLSNGQPFSVKDLGVAGAITALLKDAVEPNLVQTTENTPAIIHGGPFANIAHGCNSIIATKMALSHAPYVVTEAGFGADLGAEKFFNIKCRKAGLNPKLTILVVTTQALKMHGGADIQSIKDENIPCLTKGLENMDKHISNMKSFGQSVLVALNKYGFDTDKELALIEEHCKKNNVSFAINEAFLKGGEGAIALAKAATEIIENQPSEKVKFTYEDSDSIETKIEKIATKIYGAKNVEFSAKAKKQIAQITNLGFQHFPVCIAKTQYSFSDDAKAYGIAKDFTLTIRSLELNSGAEFIVAIAGDIMRMPGLPKVPQANFIDVENGMIQGLI